jgi:hypothetical protein
MLDLSGAFDKDPQRRRRDVEGKGDFDPGPPAHLPENCFHAWTAVVSMIPANVLTGSDRLGVEIAARLLNAWWLTPADLDTLKELRQWMGKFGLSPADRAKIGAAGKSSSDNPFAKFAAKAKAAQSTKRLN